MTEQTFFAVAASQLGLLSYEQAAEHLTPGQLDGRMRAGRIKALRRGVLGIAGTPPTLERELLAALLAAGPDAAVSHRSAAVLWGFERLGRPPTVELTMLGGRHVRLGGVRVHRTLIVGPTHQSTIGPFAVTSAERTLCDLSSSVPAPVLGRVLDDGGRTGVVDLDRLRSVAGDLEHRGRWRSTVIRQLLAERADEAHPGASDPELDIARLLVVAGLPQPVMEHPVPIRGREYRFDGAYPDLGIGWEYQSWEHHGHRSAFDADPVRRNELLIAGWVVLEFTSKSRPDDVVDTVRAARAARAARYARSPATRPA
jgi:hypothetical protein